MGKSIEPTDFKNLYIQDPFNTADKAVLISVTGSSKMNYKPLKTTSYSVAGNNCFPSIANTMNRVKEDGSSVFDLDLSRGALVVSIIRFSSIDNGALQPFSQLLTICFS